MFKRLSLAVLAVAVASSMTVATPAGASGTMTKLGNDPAGDAPPGSDLTSIAVTSHEGIFHIQMTFANSIPVAGTYGPLAGIEWAFAVRGRTFVAEAYPDGASFSFVLFEKEGETFRQVETLEGDFDTIGGFLNMYVPLKTIGAKRGTVIAGAGENDGDVHVHVGVTTVYPDVMTTSGTYRVR